MHFIGRIKGDLEIPYRLERLSEDRIEVKVMHLNLSEVATKLTLLISP